MEIRSLIKHLVQLGLLCGLAVALSTGTSQVTAFAAPAPGASALPSGSPPEASDISPSALIMPEDLAKLLRAPQGSRPLVVQVGFRVLYAQGHISGAEYIGPASDADVLAKLQKRVASLPRTTFIVIYCGCCPWVHCPTVRPAYAALHHMGFTRLKVLYIGDNFGRDWMAKGLPTERSE